MKFDRFQNSCEFCVVGLFEQVDSGQNVNVSAVPDDFVRTHIERFFTQVHMKRQDDGGYERSKKTPKSLVDVFSESEIADMVDFVNDDEEATGESAIVDFLLSFARIACFLIMGAPVVISLAAAAFFSIRHKATAVLMRDPAIVGRRVFGVRLPMWSTLLYIDDGEDSGE